MKIEVVTLSDGTEVVYIRQSKRRYVRVTKNSSITAKNGFKRKKKK